MNDPGVQISAFAYQRGRKSKSSTYCCLESTHHCGIIQLVVIKPDSGLGWLICLEIIRKGDPLEIHRLLKVGKSADFVRLSLFMHVHETGKCDNPHASPHLHSMVASNILYRSVKVRVYSVLIP